MEKEKVVGVLNEILEHELAGVVRYTHFSLMVYGHNRIPIVNWLRQQASESLMHAGQVGEYITSLGGHPSLKIASFPETHKYKIDAILLEGMEHEKIQLELYKKLLTVTSENISLEEYARSMVREEQDHINEVEKMLRKPE